MSFLLLSKILPLFVYPLGAALIGLLLSFAARLARFRRIAATLAGLAILLLWSTATPLFANRLCASLESQYPALSVEELPRADVGILLAGAIGQPLPPRVAPDLNDAADRVLHAARLWRAGKVSHIIVSGGVIPWESFVRPEAELIAGLLEELGVPREAIILEVNSRNTFENAINTAGIWRERGFGSGLLVTSGAHMPRALEAFQKAGMAVEAASTDIRSIRHPLRERHILSVLPQADALALGTACIKEWIGILVYRWRGWA